MRYCGAAVWDDLATGITLELSRKQSAMENSSVRDADMQRHIFGVCEVTMQVRVAPGYVFERAA